MHRARTTAGLEIVAPYRHHGSARALVHRLKYRADLDAGHRLAVAMVAVLDPACTGIVPVPRALVRRLRYGIDVGRWLSTEVGRLTGLPVLAVLTPGVWWPSRARGGAGSPGFRCQRAAPPGAYLLDDVATTGATLDAAAALSGASAAVVATIALGPFVPGHQ